MRVLRPETVRQALRALDEAGEDTTVIAGGTAVMLMMRNGLLFPEQLVSLDRLPGLDHIGVEDDVRIGALTPLRQVERSRELARVLPTLTGATALVANHRVRARATIGGNVCESDYASDPPSVLTALGCRLRVASNQGERWVPLEDFLLGYYETALQRGELVTELRIRRPSPTARFIYLKYISRSAEDRPCLGVAALVEADESGRCSEVQVAVGGATATPFRVPEVLAEARGAKIDDPGTWEMLAEGYRGAIEPIGDARGSADYRKHVTGELVRRALTMVSGGAANGAIRL